MSDSLNDSSAEDIPSSKPRVIKRKKNSRSEVPKVAGECDPPDAGERMLCLIPAINREIKVLYTLKINPHESSSPVEQWFQGTVGAVVPRGPNKSDVSDVTVCFWDGSTDTLPYPWQDSDDAVVLPERRAGSTVAHGPTPSLQRAVPPFFAADAAAYADAAADAAADADAIDAAVAAAADASVDTSV